MNICILIKSRFCSPSSTLGPKGICSSLICIQSVSLALATQQGLVTLSKPNIDTLFQQTETCRCGFVCDVKKHTKSDSVCCFGLLWHLKWETSTKKCSFKPNLIIYLHTSRLRAVVNEKQINSFNRDRKCEAALIA